MRTILLGFFALACLFVLHAFWRIFWHRQRVRAQIEAKVILDACDHLHALIKYLIQHRGLSGAWLAGDATYGQRLDSKQHYIEAVFPALQPLLAVERDQYRPSLTANELSLFRFRWRAMVEELPRLSIDESNHRHGQLINNLFDWLAVLGESLDESLSVLPGGDTLPSGVVGDYAQRLPVLADLLGQVRAWLALMIAGKRDGASAKNHLKILLGKVAAQLEQRRGTGNDSLTQLQAVAAIDVMQDLLRREVLEADKPGLNSDVLLSAVSLASDSVFLWIRSSAQVLYGVFAEAPAVANDEPTMAGRV